MLQEVTRKARSRSLLRALIVALLPGAALAGPVNINSADAATLAKELEGIGPSKAQAIVEYRQKNGAFKTPDELLQVEGIGQRTLEMNRGNIRVERGAAPSTAPAAKPKPKPSG